ncbi:M24 family metallopeptidase [Aureimonas jatrophae]|uniref:Xaa-Pro aminopeptidase n=1 Tax=Aureimonas jatrophae TaxID=1166073 RepID=A0A1H0FHS0_9HYPH|nr:Xaa-Pro peptidase family protein [Aureimonas jatrophae]MBB3950010.1 Xaa-Pro aminopeptidase [Aureimonas jatrophae]SDN94217.1 Xaa-Pro aminopeptidase [Aureimonas jatrophae]
MSAALEPLGDAFRRGVLDRLRARIAAERLDAALFLRPGNVRYLTGWDFHANERPMGVLVRLDTDRRELLVPDLERENAAQAALFRVETYEEYPGEVPAELWMCRRAAGLRLAVDALDASLLRACEGEVRELRLVDLAAPLRARKTPEELALVREAARFADLCLERLLAQAGAIVRDGGTELDLLADCTGHARQALEASHGARFAGTRLAITASVHSGPRAALPHGATSLKRPEAGETLIAGIGACLGGYHAESGATLFLGDLTPEQARVAHAMERSDRAAQEALKPGTPCHEVNRRAMEPLREAGLGEAIRHRIGHAMGVEGHEGPWLAPGDPTPVEPAMVFSSEPGVYRPGRDGFRTINTLIASEAGTEVPSRFLAAHPIERRVVALA